MRIAVLDASNIVTNIIEADEAFARAQNYPSYVVLAPGQWCTIGATWDGTSFSGGD